VQLPTLPPTKEVLDLLQPTVLPALAGAAVVVCLFRLCGRWAGALGSAVAVTTAFVWVNFAFDKPNWTDGRLLPWNPAADPENPPPGYQWLPRAALVLVVVGLVSRWLGLLSAHYLPENRRWAAGLFVWAPRLAAVVAVCGWLTTGRAVAELHWLYPTLAAVMFAEWLVLDGIARAGPAAQTALYLSIALLGAGTVLIYAHSLRFLEVQYAVGYALLGIAIAAGAGRTDTSGAIPAGVLFLPGVVLAGGPSLAEHLVPPAAFWLVALAPLALAPFLVPRLNRQDGWLARAVRLALAIAPVAVAVGLAMRHEMLPHEMPSEW
jgi:hypothetical protein